MSSSFLMSEKTFHLIHARPITFRPWPCKTFAKKIIFASIVQLSHIKQGRSKKYPFLIEIIGGTRCG
jgi:hypothetical protein